jgi:hypothetical protein
MIEITELGVVAVRAADLADRAERLGALIVANVLREIAGEVEEAIMTMAPPVLRWRRRWGRARKPVPR